MKRLYLLHKRKKNKSILLLLSFMETLFHHSKNKNEMNQEKKFFFSFVQNKKRKRFFEQKFMSFCSLHEIKVNRPVAFFFLIFQTIFFLAFVSQVWSNIFDFYYQNDILRMFMSSKCFFWTVQKTQKSKNFTFFQIHAQWLHETKKIFWENKVQSHINLHLERFFSIKRS